MNQIRKNRLFVLVFTFLCTINFLFAQNWQLSNFKKQDKQNPILSPSLFQEFLCPVSGKKVFWEARNVLNPCVVIVSKVSKVSKVDSKVFCLLYRAQDSTGMSRIGLATSSDGIHFKKNPKPILFPDKDEFLKYEQKGGIEDPRIVQTEDGGYFLTYTSYDGKTARLCGAFSKDLLSWEKIGPLLKAEKYINLWSKSGALVVENMGTSMIAKKINGFYWMYFGDTNLFFAKSTDLRHWEVCEDAENKERISVLGPRKGYFDSRLVEPGPYALLTQQGILMLYNGSNSANFGTTAFPKFTYAAGQALFSSKEPYKLLKRTDKPFIWPNKDYEKVGEVNEVCFIEGLAHVGKKWYLYYGTADSKIAVAIKDK